jgi:hypothetical protein
MNVEKYSLYNKCYWENWISTCRRMKLDPYLFPFIKLNSTCTKEFNEKEDILNVLQENIGESLEDLGNDFLVGLQ